MRLVFFILATFTAIFSIGSFDGFYFYDDYNYIFYANQILSGAYQLHNPDIFAHRLGFILPLALFIKIFGLNEWAVCSLPFLATLLSLYLLYLFSKNLASKAAIYALLFFGLDFYTLFFANKVYPDVLLTTLALASLYVFYYQRKHWYAALYFVFLNFWAFLCKELIIYFVPFYVFVCVQDLRRKQNTHFWLTAFATALLLAFAYFLLYYELTGNPFFRFQAIEQGHYTVSFSYFDKPFIHTLKRITYEPFLMFINTTTMITLAGAIVFLLVGKSTVRTYFFCSGQNFISYICLAFLLSLLMFWLMSTHFSAYNPIGLFPRHILFLLPLGAILSALALENKKTALLTSTALMLSAGWAWKSIGFKTAILYIITGIWIYFKKYSFFQHKNAIWTIGLAFVLALHPVYTMFKPTETGYWAEKELFESYILPMQKPCIIYTDDKLLTGHQWYFSFEKPDFIVFKDFSDWEKDKALSIDKYILLNQYSIRYFKELGVAMPKFIETTPQNWRSVVEKKGVTLYVALSN
ncbi:MAG: hypothetical protein OHK0045_05760 [Raineya sp.]